MYLDTEGYAGWLRDDEFPKAAGLNRVPANQVYNLYTQKYAHFCEQLSSRNDFTAHDFSNGIIGRQWSGNSHIDLEDGIITVKYE